MVVAALVIITLNQLKINVGRVWLTAAVFALVNWGLVFSLKWLYPVNYSFVKLVPIFGFLPGGIFTAARYFLLADCISFERNPNRHNF